MTHLTSEEQHEYILKKKEELRRCNRDDIEKRLRYEMLDPDFV